MDVRREMPKFPWWTRTPVFTMIQVEPHIIGIIQCNLFNRLDSSRDRCAILSAPEEGVDGGDVQIDESSCFFLEEINHFHLSIHAEIIPQFLFSVCFKVLDTPNIDVSSGVLLVVGRSCVFSSIACSPSYPQSESFDDYSLGEGCTVEQSRTGRVDKCCKLYISIANSDSKVGLTAHCLAGRYRICSRLPPRMTLHRSSCVAVSGIFPRKTDRLGGWNPLSCDMAGLGDWNGPGRFQICIGLNAAGLLYLAISGEYMFPK